MRDDKIICIFKCKDEILFQVYNYKEGFYCKLMQDVDWSKYSALEKMAIGEAFKLPKQFQTIEELRQGTKYYTGDYRFVWERYLYGSEESVY